MTLRCKDCGTPIERVRLSGRPPERCAACREKVKEEWRKRSK